MKRKPVPNTIVQQAGAQSYAHFFSAIKERIRTAQIKAALAANAELVRHYWEIGREILDNQKGQGWGAEDHRPPRRRSPAWIPESQRLLGAQSQIHARFCRAWPDAEIVHQLGAQIPWKHNCVLLDRVKHPQIREFYIRKTVEHGWSRSVLIHQLDTKLHKRIGKAPSNFALTLPAPQSDWPAKFSRTLTFSSPHPWMESATERALEQALLERLKDFLLELGAGFAFVGNQYQDRS